MVVGEIPAIESHLSEEEGASYKAERPAGRLSIVDGVVSDLVGSVVTKPPPFQRDNYLSLTTFVPYPDRCLTITVSVDVRDSPVHVTHPLDLRKIPDEI